MDDQYGFIGKNTGYETGDFEEALTAKGSTYQVHDVDRQGLYGLTYSMNGMPRYAYVRTMRYEVDGFGQDVFIFNRPIPDDQVAAVLESL